MKLKISLILSLMLLLSHNVHVITAESSGEEWILQKFNVRIANSLPGNSPMDVHCESGDDDLGVHTVGPHQEYGFSFRLNLFKTTRFWCHVRWDSGDVRAVGDVFWPNDDFLSRCRHNSCVWVVNEDGIEFRDPLTNDVFVYYDWE